MLAKKDATSYLLNIIDDKLITYDKVHRESVEDKERMLIKRYFINSKELCEMILIDKNITRSVCVSGPKINYTYTMVGNFLVSYIEYSILGMIDVDPGEVPNEFKDYSHDYALYYYRIERDTIIYTQGSYEMVIETIDYKVKSIQVNNIVREEIVHIIEYKIMDDNKNWSRPPAFFVKSLECELSYGKIIREKRKPFAGTLLSIKKNIPPIDLVPYGDIVE